MPRGPRTGAQAQTATGAKFAWRRTSTDAKDGTASRRPWVAGDHSQELAHTATPPACAGAVTVCPHPVATRPSPVPRPQPRRAPAALPLASDLAQLSADLVAWCDQSTHRDDALRDARATTVTARDAAEALREALARLDLEIERAAGGTRSPTYTSWAAVAGQLG